MCQGYKVLAHILVCDHLLVCLRSYALLVVLCSASEVRQWSTFALTFL